MMRLWKKMKEAMQRIADDLFGGTPTGWATA